MERESGEFLGVLSRVTDCRRAQNKLGVATESAAQAPQTPDHVSQVGAKNPSVNMGFVDDHKPQPSDELIPCPMVRKDPKVQHVRVGHEQSGWRRDVWPVLRRRIAVEGAVPNAGALWNQLGEESKLVLGQGFRRVEIQRATGPVSEQRLQHREMVAKALATGGRRGHDHVLALPKGRDSLRLMSIQVLDAQPFESLL